MKKHIVALAVLCGDFETTRTLVVDGAPTDVLAAHAAIEFVAQSGSELCWSGVNVASESYHHMDCVITYDIEGVDITHDSEKSEVLANYLPTVEFNLDKLEASGDWSDSLDDPLRDDVADYINNLK